MALAAPTGAIQFSWNADPAHVAVQILSTYYDSVPETNVVAGYAGDEPIESDLLDTLGLGIGRDSNDPIRKLSISAGTVGVGL